MRLGDSVPECGHWIGAERRYCGSTDDLHAFMGGLRCPLHTPAAVAGRPEPPQGPGWPEGAWTGPSTLGTSAVFDERAIASGKRRSSPHAYRAAQAAVKPATETDLRVDLGHWDEKRKRWLRYPAADFRCPRGCGFTDSASGDAVARFAAHIRDDHKTNCTKEQQT